MYEIKSRWDGKTIYVAKNATDVRQAVEDAVNVGARLFGASLDGASLVGARLVGARLDGASLVGARLVGARLDGARLVGASLFGASLDKKTWDEVATKLEISIQAMNDNGRHWIKGSLQSTLEDGSHAYCSVGSVQAHSGGTVRAVSLWLLSSVAGGSVERFNDFDGTTWEDVQLIFSVAIKHARRFATT